MELDSRLNEKWNIFKKMSAISDELNCLDKDIEIQSEKKNYKVASEGLLISYIKPLEKRYGVYSYPAKVEVIGSGLEKVKGRTGSYLLYWIKIKVVYRFVNIEDPSDFFEVETLGTGTDFVDKEGGKALTYAVKYALAKAYKVQYYDDPDTKASEKIFADLEDGEAGTGKYTTKTEKSNTSPKNSPRTKDGEPIISEKQREYIEKLRKQKDYNEMIILDNYGYTLDDRDIPVGVANEIIQYLKGCRNLADQIKMDVDDDDLPF